MGTIDDVISNIKGGVTNLSQVVQAFGAPARTVQGINTPVATILTTLGSSSLLAVAANTTRRAISFHNSSTAGTTIWVVPSTITAVIGRGVPIVPGGDFVIDTMLGSNCGWNAIAAGGTNVLTVLEYI